MAAALKTSDGEGPCRVPTAGAPQRHRTLRPAGASLSLGVSARHTAYPENTALSPVCQGTKSPFGRPVGANRAFVYSANIYGPSAVSQASRLRADGGGIRAFTCGLRW